MNSGDKAGLLSKANEITRNTLMETLGIRFTDVGEDYAEATMEVGPHVHQPAGILHGGASVALAESLGSSASHLLVNDPSKQVVGLEINANHIRAIRQGTVTARAELVHGGRRTHVWDIRIRNEEGKLICICRLTNIIVDAS